MSTQTTDLLPTQGTPADFRRLAAIVSMERGYTAADQAPWAPDDVARHLWISRHKMPFPELARLAMAVARNTNFQGPAAVSLAAFNVAEVKQ